MYRNILIPTDGSSNSKRAAQHALKIIDLQGNLIILHIIERYSIQPGVLPISTITSVDENLYDELEQEGKDILKEIKEYLREKCPEKYEKTNFTCEIREGKPDLEILKTMEEEDVNLVVMGASGRHGLDRVVLGSVTERVIRKSNRPTLIIP